MNPEEGHLLSPLPLREFVGCAERSEAHRSRLMRFMPDHPCPAPFGRATVQIGTNPPGEDWDAERPRG
jgi:hypothetical protein